MGFICPLSIYESIGGVYVGANRKADHSRDNNNYSFMGYFCSLDGKTGNYNQRRTLAAS